MNLSQIKATVAIGDEFDVTNHYITKEDHPCFGTRRGWVSKVTSGAFYLNIADGSQSRIEWPKAAQVEATPDGFALYGGGVGQQPTDLFLTIVRVKPEPEPFPDQYAHLRRCMNAECGLPIYYVEGQLVDAIGHGSICDDEDAPHKDPDAACHVEVIPVAPAEDEKSMVVTTPDDATMWAVYVRSNEGLAMWECDQDERADANVAALELAFAKDVPALDHVGKPIPTVALAGPAELVGRTVAAVTTRELIARDTFKDYVQWTETVVTTTDGRHYTFAVDEREVYAPSMEAETCVCGHVIVKEDDGYVHPFSYDIATPIHDPEPVSAP